MYTWFLDMKELMTAAAIGAASGRATWYSIRVQEGKRRFLDRYVIVDLMIALTMAILGLAVGDYYDLSLLEVCGISSVLGYLGPRGLEFAFIKIVEIRKGKTKDD